jgi:TonB-linked SusC/RagA family outer membrane protein
MLLVWAVGPLAAQDNGSYSAGASQRTGASAPLVTLELQDVPLRDALKAIAAQGRVSLVYASSTVPLDRRISIRVRGLPVADALRAVLHGTEVEVRETAPGQITLVRRAEPPEDRDAPAPPPAGVVSGRVSDSASGAPVPKAAVSIDAGAHRTMTNDAGLYRFTDVPSGAHVVSVRRIGYAPAERSVVVVEDGAATLDFVLSPVASRLEGVVTTVTGPQRRLEIGNAIGTIDADSVVREAPVTSLSDLINARVSGTQVVLNNGLTGTSPRIRIRGLNSLTVGNDPLLVVDGIRVDNSTGTLGKGYGQTSGRFNDLNPEEIESVEIVKGPSAATLYGTDAANGVIVVKTKRGRPGGATWAAYAEAGLVQEPTRFPDNYYAWGRSLRTGAAQQCVLTQVAAGVCQADSLTRFNPLMNGETSPIGTGNRQQYGLQVSGGVAQFSYFVAGEYEGELGFLHMPGIDQARISQERGGTAIPAEQIHPNSLAKVSLRGNGGSAIGETADLNVAFGLVSSDIHIAGDGIIAAGLWGPGYRTAQDGWLTSFASRPGEAFAVRNLEGVTHYTSSANASWRPLGWLSTRATSGLDFSSTSLDGLQLRDQGPLGGGRTGRRLNSRTNVSLYTADLGASATFAPRVRVTSRTSIGTQYNRRLQTVTTASGANLPPGAQTVTGAAVISGAEQTLASVVAGAYVEQNVGIDERLFLTGAFRADGGSAFGRDFQVAIYPKGSVSWIAVQHTGIVNSLRLRAAYGASGVQPSSTASLALVTVAPALIDGVAATGARLSAIGNPDLKPERQTELETGFDVELLGQRVRAEATYYDRLSRDALINRPLASEIGILSRQENLGSVRNRGVEGVLALTVVDDPALSWNVALNGSVNRNRLERIGAGINFIGNNPASRNRQGYPLYSAFARPILGFADTNGNGIIEEGEVQVGDTMVYVGQALPPRQLTASSSLALWDGRIRVSTQFDYRGGNRVINFTESNRCSSFFNNCQAVNDPTASLEDQARAVAFNSDRYGRTLYGYLEDGSFVRWRELAVTYSVPDAFARPLRARTASITLTGRNLRLFTGYSGVDPESNDAVGSEGYSDNSTPPAARYWLLRVNLGL